MQSVIMFGKLMQDNTSISLGVKLVAAMKNNVKFSNTSTK